MRHALETASWNWASDAARKIGDESEHARLYLRMMDESDYAQRLAQKRNAELHVIPGASHLPNFEQPDALTDEIISFIEKVNTH